jgi:hypothetical protein
MLVTYARLGWDAEIPESVIKGMTFSDAEGCPKRSEEKEERMALRLVKRLEKVNADAQAKVKNRIDWGYVSEGDVEDAERYFGSGLDGLIAVKKWFQSAEEFIRGNLVGYGIC